MTEREKRTLNEVLKKLRSLEEQICHLLDGDVSLEEEERKPIDPKNLERVVTDYIHDIGCPAHIKGYYYLRRAIVLCVEDMDIMEQVMKKLYPTIAKEFQTTPSKVERAIRHAIMVSWSRGNMETMQKLFGHTLDRGKGKPTISEFIAMSSDYIRMNLR